MNIRFFSFQDIRRDYPLRENSSCLADKILLNCFSCTFKTKCHFKKRRWDFHLTIPLKMSNKSVQKFNRKLLL